MKKPENWDSIQAAGEFEQLDLGGHVCVIKGAECKTTKSGREGITLYLDIAKGEQTGYYKAAFDRDTRENKKWPVGGQYFQLTDGTSEKFFKGMITSIEKSNPGYTWNWDEKTLKGKFIGGVFGREEYIGKNDGKPHMSVKCMSVRSIDGIEEVAAPPDKLLSGNSSSNYTSTSDDDLPF